MARIVNLFIDSDRIGNAELTSKLVIESSFSNFKQQSGVIFSIPSVKFEKSKILSAFTSTYICSGFQNKPFGINVLDQWVGVIADIENAWIVGEVNFYTEGEFVIVDELTLTAEKIEI